MFLILKCIFSSLIFFKSGQIICRILKIQSNKLDFSIIAFLGVILISFVALASNFITSLNNHLNTIYFCIILSYFFFDKDLKIKQIIITGLIASLILFLAKTNNPDGGLYHLPYTQILNEQKIIFGLNNLHFRFSLATLFQYSSAIFNNIFLGVEGINIPSALVVSFFLFFLTSEIVEIMYKKKINNHIPLIFLTLLLLSSLYSFNRYSNYGNDVPLHVYYFLLIILFYKFYFSDYDNDIYKVIFIIATFLFLNKITFILCIFVPLFIYFYLKKKIIFDRLYFFIFLFCFMWLIKNFIISGCFIFPLTATCFENISWTNILQASQERIAGEAWSKGWPDQKIYNSYQEFLSNFNWVSIWFKTHFYVILEKFGPILISFFIFTFVFFIKGEKFYINKLIIKKEVKFIILFSLLNFILWFLFFPIYRYGYGFILIFFLFLYIISFQSFLKKPDDSFLRKYILLLLIIGYSSFIYKNLTRILTNYNVDYNGKPFPNIIYSNYQKENKHIIKKDITENFYYYYAPDLCFYNKSPCTNYKILNLRHKRKLNYDILYFN